MDMLQAWYDDPSENADGLFETVVCKACGQRHLVDPKTKKSSRGRENIGPQ